MSEPFADAAPGIAFIYSDESFAAHVREAIDAKVHIVYQASAGELDTGRLSTIRAAAALVNLDGSSNGEKLEQVTAALDAAGVPVVFNDAEISRGLDGWARARWVRHLLAKLCGSKDFDPPRPGAQSPQHAGHNADEAATAIHEAGTAIDATPLGDINASDPGIASRPLSRHEIESLVADFPAADATADHDTAELAAMIDARLAEGGTAPEAEATSWETAAQIGETVVEAAPEDTEAEPAPMPPAVEVASQEATTETSLPELPAADQWQLVDDQEPVISAPNRAAAKPADAFTGSLSDLELVPMDDAVPVKIEHVNEATEMRLESAKKVQLAADGAGRGGDAA